MSVFISRFIELPQNARAVVEALQSISTSLTANKEQDSWRVFTISRSEYARFIKYIRHPLEADLYDCWQSIRYDYIHRTSILAMRLPSVSQVLFTSSLHEQITRSIDAIADAHPNGWFLKHIMAINPERDSSDDALVFNAHRPDLSFYFTPEDPPSPPSSPSSAVAPPRKRPRVPGASEPTLIVEICNAAKHGAMQMLAERYTHGGGGATRTVVAVDTERGVFSVWRFLRYLPTKLEGKTFRRCFLTQDSVAWRGAGTCAEGEGLVLSVRDFMPTVLPDVEDVSPEEMDELMRRKVVLDPACLTKMWLESWSMQEAPLYYGSEGSEGSEGMDFSDSSSSSEDDVEEPGEVEMEEPGLDDFISTEEDFAMEEEDEENE
ncbi:uncharacterized protein LTHEOB_6414 [Lasiodiplodia theobromae]|uniref:uncharacterized protein n=1 Tax=Lasiodiplodia theobromae TaxID=45133 RepID=UPI0015C3590F|nr:uncharacterized protein LTHEOB_6414 [Lasiodiplodia theobromae]KAF4544296.1 hypothetical protein LTHEOB_6414 [Lasiodiplodia theobromae]